jgi:hypothetical protein
LYAAAVTLGIAMFLRGDMLLFGGPLVAGMMLIGGASRRDWLIVTGICLACTASGFSRALLCMAVPPRMPRRFGANFSITSAKAPARIRPWRSRSAQFVAAPVLPNRTQRGVILNVMFEKYAGPAIRAGYYYNLDDFGIDSSLPAVMRALRADEPVTVSPPSPTTSRMSSQ